MIFPIKMSKIHPGSYFLRNKIAQMLQGEEAILKQFSDGGFPIDSFVDITVEQHDVFVVWLFGLNVHVRHLQIL